MRVIDSNPCLAKRVALKGIEKFRKAYKVPMPRRIKNGGITFPVAIGYIWNNIFGKSCELWVVTDEQETRWNCLVTEGMDHYPLIHSTVRTRPSYETCGEEWEMAQSIAECLELWFSTNVRAP
jgi:hypothetical protein